MSENSILYSAFPTQNVDLFLSLSTSLSLSLSLFLAKRGRKTDTSGLRIADPEHVSYSCEATNIYILRSVTRKPNVDDFRQSRRRCSRANTVRLSIKLSLSPLYPRISIMRILFLIIRVLIAANAAAGAWIIVVCLDFNADTNIFKREENNSHIFYVFLPSLLFY